MKKEKLMALRSILFSVALSQAALTGCASTMTTEQLEKSIENHSNDFKKDAGLYKDENGNWDIYYYTHGNYYNFKTHESLEDGQFLINYEDGYHIFYVENFNGYMPFFRCNPNVTYTKNMIENLSKEDIDSLKNDFLDKNTFRASNIKLFRIEKIDKSSSTVVIGIPVSKTKIFNMETWQIENYEGYSIIQENCNFGDSFVSVKEVLNYFYNVTKEEKESKEISDFEEENKEETTKESKEEKSAFEFYSDGAPDDFSIDINEECTLEDVDAIIERLDENMKMTHLSIDGNNKEISKKIFKKISELKNLKQLYLLRIQNLDLSFTESLSLRGITLDECTLRNMETLKSLKELDSFTAFYCNIDDVEPLSEIKSLKSLTLIESDKYKELKSLESLENLKQLSSLDLCQYRINDLSFLKDMNQLYFLNIETNNILDVEPVMNLKNLQVLDLEETYIKNIDVLTELKRTKENPLTLRLSPNSNLVELVPYIKQLKEQYVDVYIEENLQEIPLDDYLNKKDLNEEENSLQLKLK